jgi:exopolysaccharide production protein ExoY
VFVAVELVHLRTFTVETQYTAPASESSIWRLIGACERVVAGTLLIGALPLLLVAGIVIMALSRRSPLIAHRRIGKGGRLLWVLKLRTMWDDRFASRVSFVEWISAEPRHPLTLKRSIDSRITSRFAALCRRYSVDELPQFWNVLRGEMSLIGPRPLTSREIKTYYGDHAVELLSRRPGMSGLWQVSGRSCLSYKQRRKLDLFMIRRWCFRLYLRILASTFSAVITGKNAW